MTHLGLRRVVELPGGEGYRFSHVRAQADEMLRLIGGFVVASWNGHAW